MSFRAVGPDGQVVGLTWGPDQHSRSDWDRPGEEWGTGWILPASGCWILEATRGSQVVAIAAEAIEPPDTAIDATERTRRTFLTYLRQHESEIRHVAQFAKRSPPGSGVDRPKLDLAIERGWQSLRATAESMATAGYKLTTSRRPGSKYVLGDAKPSIGESVETAIETFHGLTKINLYSIYSPVAHVEGAGLGYEPGKQGRFCPETW